LKKGFLSNIEPALSLFYVAIIRYLNVNNVIKYLRVSNVSVKEINLAQIPGGWKIQMAWNLSFC
jgi:hypothetical protein